MFRLARSASPIFDTRKGRFPIRPLALIVLAVGFVRLASCYTRLHPTPPPKQWLSVPESSLDFGEAWEAQEFDWNLPITNEATQDVEIVDFDVSCVCTAVQPRSLSIPAGESRTVKLILDLRRIEKRDRNQASRAFHVDLRPSIRPPHAVRSPWTLRGRVKSALVWDPVVVDFGAIPEFNQPPMPITVGVTGLLPLERLEIASTDRRFACELHSRGLGGKEYEISLRAAPTFPVGPINAGLIITPILPGGRRIPSVTVPVRGTIVDDLYAIPDCVDLGVQTLGQSERATVRLLSHSHSLFDVEGVDIASQDTTIEPLPSAPGDRVFRFSQRITAAGECVRDVRFRVRYRDGREGVVVVPVRSYGTAAPWSLTAWSMLAPLSEALEAP